MNDLLKKIFLGELNNLEKSRLISNLDKDSELKSDFIKVKNITALSKTIPNSTDIELGEKSLKEFKRKIAVKKQVRIINMALKYAALILIVVLPTFFLTKYTLFGDIENTNFNIVYVPAGQRAKIILSDSSIVWLNSKSTLIYPSVFTKKNREVELIGEGYFDIVKNSKSRFVVKTQDMRFEVLGTKFNIFCYPDFNYIKTELFEGLLNVYNINNKSKNVVLRPNQQVVIKNKEMVLGKSPYDNSFHWKDGVYSFNNEKLGDILKKLELYYDTKIVVEVPEILASRYTGKFRQTDGLYEILKIIQKIDTFQIDRDVENNIIILKK